MKDFIDEITKSMIDPVPFLILAKQLNKISSNCGYNWQPAQIDLRRGEFVPRISRTEPPFNWAHLHNLFVDTPIVNLRWSEQWVEREFS